MSIWLSSRNKLNAGLLLCLVCLPVLSACHRGANLIPYGFEGAFDDPARGSTASRVDYSIVVTDPAKYNFFLVSKHGERTWFWQRQFWNDSESWWNWSPNWYRVMLTIDEMEQPICDTKWHARGETEPQEIPCVFDASKYIAKPLLAMLFYKMGGPKDTPPEDNDMTVGVVPRYYFLIAR